MACGETRREDALAELRSEPERLLDSRRGALGNMLSNIITDRLEQLDERGAAEEEHAAARKDLPLPVQGAMGGAVFGGIIGGPGGLLNTIQQETAFTSREGCC